MDPNILYIIIGAAAGIQNDNLAEQLTNLEKLLDSQLTGK